MIGLSRDVVERVRMEYLEMPGLALTCCQARRLFNLDAGVCEDILAQLVGEQFLSRSISGVFIRRTVGRHPFPTTHFCVPAPWTANQRDTATDMSDLQPAADDLAGRAP